MPLTNTHAYKHSHNYRHATNHTNMHTHKPAHANICANTRPPTCTNTQNGKDMLPHNHKTQTNANL
jgi:hypothetical protein